MTDLAIFLSDLAGGGAERVMVNLAEGFAARGFGVDLVLARREGPYLADLSGHIRVVDLKASRLLLGIPRLKAYLRETRPRVLLSALEDTNVVALVAAKLTRIPLRTVVTVHNHVSLESRHSRQLKRKLSPLMVKFFYPMADCVVAVSEGVAKDLIRLGSPADRTCAIYNPILTPALRAQLAERVEHPWFAAGEPPVILAMGRFHSQKNFPMLVRAFAEVHASRPCRLMILGEGAERAALEGLIDALGLRDALALPGFVGNPSAYLSQAALLALSSDWEGFGNVLVEAMAVGTPVVSTDCASGPAEILAEGRFGRLVPVGDSHALARAIQATLDELPDRKRLQQRAEDFTLEHILDQYEDACFPEGVEQSSGPQRREASHDECGRTRP